MADALAFDDVVGNYAAVAVGAEGVAALHAAPEGNDAGTRS
jgi:hypothetical protein